MLKRLLIAPGLLLFGIGVLATLALPDQQPRLPVELGGADGLEVVGLAGGPAGDGLRAQDRIRAVNGVPVPDGGGLAFLLDGTRAGDRIRLRVWRAGGEADTSAVLIRSMGTSLLVINTLVCLLLWALGMFVVLKGAFELTTVLFYAATMSLTAVMGVYWPENNLGLPWGASLSNLLSNGLYPFTVAFLLHFALVFPEGIRRAFLRRLAWLLYGPALGLAVGLVWSQSAARASLSAQAIALNQALFTCLRIYLGVYLVLSMGFLAANFLRARQTASRQRIKWIFWGTFIGIAPHVLLFELPKGLGLQPLLPEEITYLLVLFACLAVAIAIVRYKFLDVDVVIHRSVVYFSLSLIVVLAYLLLVALGDWLAVAAWGETWVGVRVLVALLLAVLFSPTRQLVQKAVDRMFYRAQVDQRAALMEYSSRLARTVDMRTVLDALAELLAKTLPVEGLWVHVLEDGQVLREVFPVMAGGAPVPFSEREVSGLLKHRDAVPVPHPPPCLPGAALVVPLRMDQQLVGLIALGPRTSGEDFREEDLRFLSAVGNQTVVALEITRAVQRIRDLNASLEQKVFERTHQLAEANDRLAENFTQLQKLDEMKEALTRMVVHDLKNPLCNLLLGLEVLDDRERAALPEAVRHVLGIMTRTTQEMQELITNLLEITRMESGALVLRRELVPLDELVGEGLRRLEEPARARQIQLRAEVEGDLRWDVDRALMTRVLVNLLTNAVKFASTGSTVEVRAFAHPVGGAESATDLAVINAGPVIPPEVRMHLFEKFFTSDRKRAGIFAGTGLGLTFCKLVVEAHGGRIELDSPAPRRLDGTRFTVVIPERAPLRSNGIRLETAPAAAGELG